MPFPLKTGGALQAIFQDKMTKDQDTAPLPIRIGVSRCLLGDEVRYDGGHKRNSFV
jgi:hypothetical protein